MSVNNTNNEACFPALLMGVDAKPNQTAESCVKIQEMMYSSVTALEETSTYTHGRTQRTSAHD